MITQSNPSFPFQLEYTLFSMTLKRKILLKAAVNVKPSLIKSGQWIAYELIAYGTFYVPWLNLVRSLVFTLLSKIIVNILLIPAVAM